VSATAKASSGRVVWWVSEEEEDIEKCSGRLLLSLSHRGSGKESASMSCNASTKMMRKI